MPSSPPGDGNRSRGDSTGPHSTATGPPGTSRPSQSRSTAARTTRTSAASSTRSAAKRPEQAKIEDIIRQNDTVPTALEESSETVLALTPRVEPSEPQFSLWTADKYFHYRFRHVATPLRYLIEVCAVAVIFLAVPLLCLVIAHEWPRLKNIFGRSPEEMSLWATLFKLNVCCLCWYAVDIFLYAITESTLRLANLIFRLLWLAESEICWSIAQTAYVNRQYLRNALTALCAFYLGVVAFGGYARPDLNEFEPGRIFKTLLLWFCVANALLFTTKSVVGIATFRVKRAVYRDSITEINTKAFVFQRLRLISDAGSNRAERAAIIDDTAPEYDTGTYLRYTDLFVSEEDARITATNILVLMGKRALSYDDVAECFPENPDAVYRYLAESEGPDDTAVEIRGRQFIARAEELYREQRDMARSLRDRDAVYTKLDWICTIAAAYLSIVVLLVLFKADYRVFMASFGTAILTFSWVFADSIKSIYNCFIFLLIIRPYSIGDRVVINNVVMVVHKVDLLTTTFLTVDMKLTYIPNTTLITTPIANLARSPAQSDTVELSVNASTAYEHIEQLQDLASDMLQERSQLFTGCNLRSVVAGKLVFRIGHAKNFQNYPALYERRAVCVRVLREAMDRLGIEYNESFVFT